MKKFLILFLVVVSLFVVTGCGKDLSKYAGTYVGEYSKFVGDSEDSKDYEEFSLELKANGTGISKRNGLTLNITWDIKNGKFTMQEKMGALVIDYTGKFEENKLITYNGDENNDLTYKYVYNKQ